MLAGVRFPQWCALVGLFVVAACGATGTGELRTAPAAADGTAAANRVPILRADGRRWTRTPRRLRAAFKGPVLVAGTASDATLSPLSCGIHDEEATFVNGRIDEFSLTLTFRRIGDAGQVEGTPVVQRCTGRWGAHSGTWRSHRVCAHYAPASSLAEIMRSGGGFMHCEFRDTSPVVMALIVPPPGARWIVAERSRGYSVAYPVTRREAINITHFKRDVNWIRGNDQARFPFAIVDQQGRVKRKSFMAYVAG